MRVLSLRQPWASLVVFYGKRIENRKWNTHHRGPFLIHAAKQMEPGEFEAAYKFALAAGAALPSRVELLESLRFGGIVGHATLVDVLRPNPVDRADWYPPGVDGRWHLRDQFAFLLDNVTPLPFQACRGMPGFFEAPAGVWP